MVSQPCVDGITDTVTHDIAATSTARPDPGRRRHIQPLGGLP